MTAQVKGLVHQSRPCQGLSRKKGQTGLGSHLKELLFKTGVVSVCPYFFHESRKGQGRVALGYVQGMFRVAFRLVGFSGVVMRITDVVR